MIFKEIGIDELDKVVSMISKQWMLVTAGNPEAYNTLTASWGGIGSIWNSNAATIYIRPSRYTKKFLDENETFSLSFLPENYREALNLCGTLSGRHLDKIQKARLHVAFDGVTPFIEEADTVLICKKMYVQQMKKESMLIDEKPFYPEGDYHCLYIGQIQKIQRK